MKKYLISIGLLAISATVMAQSGTKSPYSQFGLGKLADRSVGAARGMNGVGIAFRDHNQINSQNPASYSAIDSLTFILDLGMSLQNTNFKEGGKSKNIKNANFEYAVATFRAMKGLGVSFGILPYSNIGYDYSVPYNFVPNYVAAPSTSPATTYSMSYSGEGGLHEVFIGTGWEPVKGLSVGVDVGYMWGSVNNYITQIYSDAAAFSSAKMFYSDISSYKLDFGVQYSRKFTKNDVATIGVTYNVGHKLGADSECFIISGDTTTARAKNCYSIPTELGIGLAWRHKNQIKVGLDYTLQKWSSISSVDYVKGTTNEVIGKTSSFTDRHSLKLGGEYCKNEYARSFTDRLRYRFGVGYTSSYLKVGSYDGPREISVSAGIGVPIVNAYNNRSVLNIGFSWQNQRQKDLLTENILLLNIGLTFNERWFAKWKFE